MTKLIRFDEDHFGYLLDNATGWTIANVEALAAQFKEYWPGKKLMVLQADEFIDLTGQYEIVPIEPPHE